MAQKSSEKIEMLKSKIEPTLVAILMAQHSRLGSYTGIPADVITLIAQQVHKDVSNKSTGQFFFIEET